VGRERAARLGIRTLGGGAAGAVGQAVGLTTSPGLQRLP
jgi:hypothetical protein